MWAGLGFLPVNYVLTQIPRLLWIPAAGPNQVHFKLNLGVRSNDLTSQETLFALIRSRIDV